MNKKLHLSQQRSAQRETKKRLPKQNVALDDSKPSLLMRMIRALEQTVEALLHLNEPTEPRWKYLIHVLVLAFVARAVIALHGDFVAHPDEIMQYLEPAHRLVFGNGISYWEFYYGARFWLIPGLIAGVLKLFDVVGLGDPFWYVSGVKLIFATASLVIPAGMYFFARWHFSESSARIALVAGAFWYEIAAFAHKPMTEFVATVPLMALLALSVRPSIVKNAGVACLSAVLAVLASSIRLQYIPLAILLLAIVFVRTQRKVQLVLVAAVLVLVAGMIDAISWDAGLFHSWFTNINFNLALAEIVDVAGGLPSYQFLLWMVIASGGLVLFAVAAVASPRRYGYLLLLVATVLIGHSLQAHKEYRFIFTVWPLVILIAADVLARMTERFSQHRLPVVLASCLFAAVSVAGLMNALPKQPQYYVYGGTSDGIIRFVRAQDPMFAAYRYLSEAEGVGGVIHLDRDHYALTGYYYLHNKIPFYDMQMSISISPEDYQLIATHILVNASDVPELPGFTLKTTFGNLELWHRDGDDSTVYEWSKYTPIMLTETAEMIMREVAPDAPASPLDFGIEVLQPKQANDHTGSGG